LRHSSPLKTVFEGENSGWKYRGRPEIEYIEHIMKNVKTKSYEIDGFGFNYVKKSC
jgi:hypothetical protein